MAYTTIDDPSAYFQTALYTSGTGASITVTNDGNSDLQPDWIWIKVRNGANDHNMFDSSRSNFAERQWSNLASASDSVVSVSANSDGFATGTGYGDINNTSGANNYVAWQWKANGGTTASNTDGSITSTVQANTTAGFSIVTYTGTATGGATIGHGLGVAPKVVITKTRAIADNWLVYHAGIGATKYLTLNTTGAAATSSGAWNDTAPSSSVVTLGSFDNSNDNDSMVAYCFAEIQGYSKFGSYTGNNNANGTFVYTGFKPALLILKNTDDAVDWYIFDNKRDTDNVVQNIMHPNKSDAASDSAVCDFLSNGFKFRTADNAWNGNGDNYIYMAFAEHPFVSSEGVPTTAR